MRIFCGLIVLAMVFFPGPWMAPCVWGQFQERHLPPVGEFDNLFGPGPTGSVVNVAAQFTVPTGEQPTARLFITATIQPGWHIYSTTQKPGGPLPTTIRLERASTYRSLDGFRAYPAPESKTDPMYDNLDIQSHYDSVTWYAPIELATGVDPATLQIVGSISTGPCDSNTCLSLQEIPFAARLGPGVEIPAADGNEATGNADIENGAAPLSPKKLLSILVGAFLGGLILNLMPCVLPVISLKLLAFVEQSGQSGTRIFVLNLWYTAGLMVVFLALATLSALLGMAWGEQFTLIWFKVAMTSLVFVMALSFLGVWEVPIPGFMGSSQAGELQAREGPAGAFFKGIFTTILATPCTGPFLGPVFGFMLNQPPYIVYLIFGTVGLGMASPYLLIGAMPELIRLLPKPGAWMGTLKEVMGFLLLATMVYLFTTMGSRYFVPTLTLLIGLWFACWLIGRTPLTATGSQKGAAWLGGASAAAVVGVLAFTLLLQDLKLPWREFSPDALRQARAEGKTVMVDFTADWCPNCKWNLKVAIDTNAVNQLVRQNDVVPMIADWTDRSPIIKEVLAKDLKRQAIPVLAIWPAGAPDDGVMVLDGTLLESQVLAALKEAGPSRSKPPEPPPQNTSPTRRY